MIRDLSGAGEQRVDADILVIGGGTAGLAISARLAANGIEVVCLESGDRTQKTEEHPLNEVVHTRAVYAGAEKGRFRSLGGTSTRWGGALIPFQKSDLDGHHWPISHEEILRHRPDVEAFFGLPAGSYEPSEGFEDWHDYIARLAKWPPFARRNVANLLAGETSSDRGPRIWLNATATDFDVRDGVLRGVKARAPDGSSVDVAARQIVIAAGAIETTRLLLLMDQQSGGLISGGDDQLGRYFHDHLSVVVADLEVRDRRALNQLVGFRFERGGAMRNLRFELTDETPLRATVPPCFAHVAFVEQPGGGFDALRDFFRQIQQRRPPGPAILLRLVAAAPWLMRAIWWHFVRHRLLYPAGAQLQVHMVIEQVPEASNRIRLSRTRTDPFGKALAEIDWSPTAADVTNLTRAVDAFQGSWEDSQLNRLARFIRRPVGAAESELAQGGGIYHPGGSTRMAEVAAAGVVDADLALFHCPNVSVVATSVLPNGGGANPTMMLMMLAFRCVARLTTLLRR